MKDKSIRTECTGLNWGDLLILLDRLKKEKEYKFLLLVSIGAYTGMRVSDILSLKWENLLSKKELEISEKKTGKLRRISFNESLEELIKLCSEKIGVNNGSLKSFVFANRWGRAMTVQYINRKLHEIFQRNKIPARNPSSHTLRKTFGKRIFEMAGQTEASLILLSQIFNHSSTAITRKYIGPVDEQVQQAYLSL